MGPFSNHVTDAWWGPALQVYSICVSTFAAICLSKQEAITSTSWSTFAGLPNVRRQSQGTNKEQKHWDCPTGRREGGQRLCTAVPANWCVTKSLGLLVSRLSDEKNSFISINPFVDFFWKWQCPTRLEKNIKGILKKSLAIYICLENWRIWTN